MVLFDLDDTLFAHREAVEDGILRHLGVVRGPFVGADPMAAQSLWRDLEEEHYHSYLAGRLDFHGQRRERARDFCAAYNLVLDDASASAWFESYFVHYRDSWRLHGDALACLDALTNAGVRVGLITNGDLEFQSEKIRRVGLADRVEHVITSGELGVAKPDARIFHHACSVFGVEPSAAAYVGDRLRTDAIGAAASGLAGIWIDRRAVSVTPDDAADMSRLGILRIATLAGLPSAARSGTPA
nr:HAD family hydrolase [Cryobacterium roopkundense]